MWILPVASCVCTSDIHAEVAPIFAGTCSFAPSTVMRNSGWKCKDTFVWPFGKHAISVLFQNASGFAPKSLPHDSRTIINTRTPRPMRYFFILVDYFLFRARARYFAVWEPFARAISSG